VGPVELQVDRSPADEARALLAQADAGGLDDAAVEAAWASSVPDESQAPRVLPPGRGLGVFRGLVLAELALLFVNALLGGSLAADAPTEVRAFLETLHYSRALRDLARDLYPFMLVLSVVALLGLLVPWRLARHLYLISWAWALLQYTFGGGSFGYGLASLLAVLQTMLGGAILALAYGSPVADAFGTTKGEPHRAPGGRPPDATG